MNTKKELNKIIPKQSPLERLKVYATLNGFELLTTEWKGLLGIHRFKNIDSGELYEGCPKSIISQGFPKNLHSELKKDIRSKLDNLNELSVLANKNGFELLEKEWKGSMEKYQFKHIASGKVYVSIPYNVVNKGFPKELHPNLDKLQTLAKYAKDNGFELAETEWKGAANKHKFKHIESGNMFESSPNQLMTRGFPKNDIKPISEIESGMNLN